MADSPIRIAVELDGIEPNTRFQAALDELSAATAELIDETSEVTGFAKAGGGAIDGGVWTDMRPGTTSFNIGRPPKSMKTTGDLNLRIDGDFGPAT